MGKLYIEGFEGKHRGHINLLSGIAQPSHKSEFPSSISSPVLGDYSLITQGCLLSIPVNKFEETTELFLKFRMFVTLEMTEGTFLTYYSNLGEEGSIDILRRTFYYNSVQAYEMYPLNEWFLCHFRLRLRNEYEDGNQGIVSMRTNDDVHFHKIQKTGDSTGEITTISNITLNLQCSSGYIAIDDLILSSTSIPPQEEESGVVRHYPSSSSGSWDKSTSDLEYHGLLDSSSTVDLTYIGTDDTTSSVELITLSQLDATSILCIQPAMRVKRRGSRLTQLQMYIPAFGSEEGVFSSQVPMNAYGYHTYLMTENWNGEDWSAADLMDEDFKIILTGAE